MTTAPKIAPVKFAKTSNISADRVSVNKSCAISIDIPYATERTKTTSSNFLELVFLNWYFKHKNQSIINTKWKNACTNLSRLTILTWGISVESIKHKEKTINVQETAANKYSFLSTYQRFIIIA